MDEQTLKLAKNEYERFKLQWMLDHGFTLANLVCELGQLCKESGSDVSLEAIFMDWEFGYGFGSQIWPCFDEFLECEYKEMKTAHSSLRMPPQEAEKRRSGKETDSERSVVAQLKNQPQPGRKKAAPKRSAEKEL